MSIGSFGGVTGSAAGAPLPASQGSEAERAQKDAAAQSRGIDYEKHAQQTGEPDVQVGNHDDGKTKRFNEGRTQN